MKKVRKLDYAMLSMPCGVSFDTAFFLLNRETKHISHFSRNCGENFGPGN
jgi:hypothetical protein